MATIATNVLWGSSPNTYFDFSYDKRREGSTQYYKISVSCKPITGGSFFGYPIYLQIFLDDTSVATHTLKTANPSQWTEALTYTTDWLSVSNKVVGTTKLTVRIYSSATSGRDTSYSYNLAIDPSPSTISCTTTNIESNPVITIARASSSFTHTITYRFGTLTGTIAEKTTATSITTWTIPEEFYTQIPDSKIGYGLLTCVTYSGSTPIGSATTCELIATTDENKCKPTVSGKVIDVNPNTTAKTGNENILVRYCSTARCTITTTLNKNAGKILVQTVNNTLMDGNTLDIPNVEVGVFDFYAKDSREYHNTDKETNTLVPYVMLTANVTGWRVDPTSGNAVLRVEGNCFKGNFGAKDNTLTIQYQNGDVGGGEVKPTIKDDSTYSVDIPLSGLDYTKAFNYEVVVFDELSTVTKTTTIQKGIPVFDWGEEDFNFNVPVTINGVNILEKLAELERLVKG